MTGKRHHNFILMLLLTLSISMLSNVSAAQQDEEIPQQDMSQELHMGTKSGSFLANPQYEQLTRRLIKNIKNFDYERYRAQYAMTRGYDPMGTDARNTLLDIAYRVQNEEDPELVEAALKEYKEHVKVHLANISVVMLSMNLAKDDKRFGNPRFFARIRNGLFASVKQFGNGHSLVTAYQVVTLAEETMLLDSLGYKIHGTTPSHSGMQYYNMHAAEDLKTGRRLTLFVDITRPMSYLEQQRKENPVATFKLR